MAGKSKRAHAKATAEAILRLFEHLAKKEGIDASDAGPNWEYAIEDARALVLYFK